MTNDVATWTDQDLGAMPGLGNDRPRGGAEIKMQLEPGLAVVRYLYDNSRVDGMWSVLEERGYTWWADGLAQRVWSETAFDDAGIDIYRVFVETDLVRDVSRSQAAPAAVDELNGLLAGSAAVVDEDARTIRAVASMWVHEQSLDWVARSLSVVGAIQVAVAQAQAAMLAPQVGGEVSTSSHPDSGARPEPDEMLALLQLVRMQGGEVSAWAGDQMLFTLEQMRRMPGVALATGDDAGVTIEVPFGDATALLQLDADWSHPEFGAGMLTRLSLPGDNAGPGWAAEQNRRELRSLTRAHFLGSWIGDAEFPTEVSFLPNMAGHTGMHSVNVALSMVNRARWMAQQD